MLAGLQGHLHMVLSSLGVTNPPPNRLSISLRRSPRLTGHETPSTDPPIRGILVDRVANEVADVLVANKRPGADGRMGDKLARPEASHGLLAVPRADRPATVANDVAAEPLTVGDERRAA